MTEEQWTQGHPIVCKQSNSWYSGSTARKHNGYWRLEFTCPTCGRKGTFLRSMLGRRRIVCNGATFSKVLDADD